MNTLDGLRSAPRGVAQLNSRLRSNITKFQIPHTPVPAPLKQHGAMCNGLITGFRVSMLTVRALGTSKDINIPAINIFGHVTSDVSLEQSSYVL
jgi:hypothetical protein